MSVLMAFYAGGLVCLFLFALALYAEAPYHWGPLVKRALLWAVLWPLVCTAFVAGARLEYLERRSS